MANGEEMIWGGDTTSDERLWALIAHLTAFVFPVLGALVIYLIKKDQSRYVAYHAVQAAIFQLVLYIVGSATCGIGFLGFILTILWAIKANKGEWEGYPLIDSVGR